MKSTIAFTVAAVISTAAIIGSAETPAADNTSQQRNQSMSTVTNAQLANPWKDLWDGDLTLTPKIISEEFVAHAAPLTGSGAEEIHGRDALNAWVSGIRSVLPDLEFTIEVGPITDRDYLIVRWRARGTYAGGFPGAPASAVGRKVTFTGTDTLRIVNGKIAEYWANADSLLFVQQVGLIEVPGATPAH